MFDIGKFEIVYLQEKVRRLDAFKESDMYLGDIKNPSDDAVEKVVENIRTAIATHDYSKVSDYDFCELRIGSTVIMDKYTTKWVMERRKNIIKSLDIDIDDNDDDNNDIENTKDTNEGA